MPQGHADLPDRSRPVRVVCPHCHGSLAWSSDDARCTDCGRSYELHDTIPVLRTAVDGHKQQQVHFFDEGDAEFEIERPSGTPRLYRSLIEEKFVRSVAGIRPTLAGATALNVCGGSGMDAEYTARLG